jgi:DNA-binding SARP family transcriptional activator
MRKPSFPSEPKPSFTSESKNVVLLQSGQPAVTRRRTAPIVRIHLLGKMRGSSIRHSDILPHGRKARAILGFLCFAGGNAVPRSRIAAMLWDRVSPFQARASLRQAFRELTVAFGPLADDLLTIDRTTVRLNIEACWIDAVALLSKEPGAVEDRNALAELCKGELLEELDGVTASYDLWLLSKRTSFAENLRNLLASKLEENPATKSTEREAIARRMIEFDPTHEGASRILMRALADRKERVLALVEYRRLHGALKRAFDAEPSPETRALYEAIRTFGNAESLTTPAVEPDKKDATLQPGSSAGKRSHRRVGVMPFMPIPSAVDDNLAFSIAQEVAAALARFRWFDVVAPTGLMRVPEPTFLSNVELRRRDLDYVVDGSVSCSRGSYQISVRLLDLTTDATPVWNSKFELPTDRLDLLDEQVTAPIVAQIDPVILHIEGQPKRRNDDDALSCVMRAIPLLNTMERPKYEEAGRLGACTMSAKGGRQMPRARPELPSTTRNAPFSSIQPMPKPWRSMDTSCRSCTRTSRWRWTTLIARCGSIAALRSSGHSARPAIAIWAMPTPP